jgi:hypothetical protein
MNDKEVLKLALEALRLYQRTLAPADTQCRGVAAVAAIEQALSAQPAPVKPSLWEQYHAAQPAVQEPVALLNGIKRYEPEIFREDRIRMELDQSGEWVKYADVELLIATPPQNHV